VKLNVENVTAIIEGAAVLVALYANHQTKKELCQAKNIELLDKRIEILGKIENDEDVSENIVKLMFSKHEKDLFQNLNEMKKEKELCFKLEKTFFSLWREPDGEGGYSNEVYETIATIEDRMTQDDSISLEIELKEYCENHIAFESNTGDSYNYYEINQRKNTANKRISEYKTALIDSMKKFIEKSIKK